MSTEFDTSRRGEYVIVRAFGGAALTRLVWYETAAAVYIHDKANYERNLRGLYSDMPVGFPRKDAFVYDRDALNTYTPPELWEHLSPLVAPSAGGGGEVKHPDQLRYTDEHGTLRFTPNAIVRFLLDNGPFDMNALAKMDFSDEDRAQFAQLIGYSVSGWGELSYVSDEAWERVESAGEGGEA